MTPSLDALYDNALIWDNHACPPRENTLDFMSVLDRYHAAGVDVVGLNIGDSNVPLEELVRQAAHIRLYIDENPTRYCLVRSTAEITAAKACRRTAVLLNVEGSYALNGQAGLIPVLFDIGVRWMAMVYNSATAVGYGVHDPDDHGLTAFGRTVVAEMDRVGMIKCCSHTGYRTALDVFNATSRPTIFSHSNPRALRDHPRNIPDELIKACAATDGVIGINGVGIFLGDNDIRSETIVRHIDYVAQLVGVRHVGLGLDYVFNQREMDAALASHGGIWPPAFGYRPGVKFAAPEQIREIASALRTLGYGDDDIKGVLGANLLRVAEQVWPCA